jgi:hypothetical protein
VLCTLRELFPVIAARRAKQRNKRFRDGSGNARKFSRVAARQVGEGAGHTRRSDDARKHGRGSAEGCKRRWRGSGDAGRLAGGAKRKLGKRTRNVAHRLGISAHSLLAREGHEDGWRAGAYASSLSAAAKSVVVAHIDNGPRKLPRSTSAAFGGRLARKANKRGRYRGANTGVCPTGAFCNVGQGPCNLRDCLCARPDRALACNADKSKGH